MVYSSVECWWATARIADFIIAGSEGHFATMSANPGSIAALFAARLPESLDFSVESPIVRPLSWASDPSKDGFFVGYAAGSLVLKHFFGMLQIAQEISMCLGAKLLVRNA